MSGISELRTNSGGNVCGSKARSLAELGCRLSSIPRDKGNEYSVLNRFKITWCSAVTPQSSVLGFI